MSVTLSGKSAGDSPLTVAGAAAALRASSGARTAFPFDPSREPPLHVALTEKKGQANPIARPRRLIIHPDKVQAVRWRDLAARGAIARGKRRGKIIRAPFAFADMNERADHGAYLVL